MTTYQLKTQFQNFLRPVANHLDDAGFTPNQITVGTCVLSGVYGLALAMSSGSVGWLLGLPVFLLFRMGLNAIDGLIAKEKGKMTETGKILNEVGDVLADIALTVPFFFARRSTSI